MGIDRLALPWWHDLPGVEWQQVGIEPIELPPFAANDPRFQQATKPKPSKLRMSLGKLLAQAGRARGGRRPFSVVDTLFSVAQLMQTRKETQAKQAEDQLKEKQSRGEQEKRLRAVKLRHRVAGLPPGQATTAAGQAQKVPVPGKPDTRAPVPGRVPDSPIPELPEPRPATRSIGTTTVPTGRPVVRQGFPPIPPVAIPPGFGQPQVGAQAVPFLRKRIPFQPATPRVDIRRRPLTRIQEAGVGLLPTGVGKVVELVQPQPQPRLDPARRCKPCKEDNPKPREQCFKGLYREGPLDTEVDFTEWAEIDCFTGVEI